MTEVAFAVVVKIACCPLPKMAGRAVRPSGHRIAPVVLVEWTIKLRPEVEDGPRNGRS